MQGILVWLVAVTQLMAVPQQVVGIGKFALDETRPYVEIVFDRLGPRESGATGKPIPSIRFRLRNNCAIPISVRGSSIDESDREFIIPHEVILQPADFRRFSPAPL